jgi:hypothetical protein
VGEITIRQPQARAPLVLYRVHGQLHGQFPHCSAVDSAHSTLRKGLRLPEGSGPSAGLDTFRGCQFLVRGRKKQIALVAVFGADQSAFAVNFHPVSALWTGEPILRLVSHAVPPNLLMRKINLGRNQFTGRPAVSEIRAAQFQKEGASCGWRIATRADITGKSRREREMSLPFRTDLVAVKRSDPRNAL